MCCVYILLDRLCVVFELHIPIHEISNLRRNICLCHCSPIPDDCWQIKQFLQRAFIVFGYAASKANCPELVRVTREMGNF